MNLISCDECGTVIDLGKIHLGDDIYSKEDGELLPNTQWNGDRYVLTFPCPSCQEDIPHGG
jgi:hypothetical protein